MIPRFACASESLTFAKPAQRFVFRPDESEMEGQGASRRAAREGSSLVSDPGPPRCIAAGVRRLERAQAHSSKPRLTPHPSSFDLWPQAGWRLLPP